MAINYFCKNQKTPPITNMCYHPKDVDIRNHMYKATVKQMLCKVDQINLEEKLRHVNMRILKIILDAVPYPLQRVFLNIVLTQMDMLKHKSFKTYYLHIKQLGGGT